MLRLIFIIVILIFNLSPSPAEELVKETYNLNGQVEYDDNLIEVIYLDDNIERPEVNIPQLTLTLPVGVLNITSNTNTSKSALARAMVNRNSLSDILPLNGSAIAQSGGISYGTTWGEELSNTQWEETTSVFLRYDSPKYFSLLTSLRQSAKRDLETPYCSSIRVSPEWHITDKLTIKDTYTHYVNTSKEKNELTLVYSPSLKKYADSLKFELSAAQSYYANGKQGSELSFKTGFKF